MADVGLRIAVAEEHVLDEAGGPGFRSRWIVIAERLIFVLVACCLGWMFWLWTHERPRALFFEHGLFENLQIAILAACVLVLVPCVQLSHGVTRTISIMFLIVMVSGLVREVEVKSINGPAWWNWLTHEFSLQEILLVAGAGVLLAYAWLRRDSFWPIVRRSIHPYALPLQLGVVLVFIGAYATEKIIRKGDFSQVAEELIETAGYLLILVGILRTLDKALSERRSTAEGNSAA